MPAFTRSGLKNHPDFHYGVASSAPVRVYLCKLCFSQHARLALEAMMHFEAAPER